MSTSMTNDKLMTYIMARTNVSFLGPTYIDVSAQYKSKILLQYLQIWFDFLLYT